ncbi:MAG: DUF3592 domain-containing protein [Crocinitomicaceae bacterium]
MNEGILSELVRRIRRSDRLYQLIVYLKSEQLSEEEIEEYLSAGRIRAKEEELKSLPKKNKIKFAILCAITLLTLILYVFVLPKMGLQYTLFIAIVGAVIFSAALLYSIVYYDSWEEENIKREIEIKEKNQGAMSAVFMFIPIPAVIFSFIFSSVLERGEDNLLKETQVEAEGVIVAGSSNTIGIRRGDINFSSVSVEFYTKEGERILATEDISEYEFKDYRKGQKVKLIYSSEDPQIIELLTSKSAIRKFKDSEERDIKARDLLVLIDANDTDVLSLLNKISYGWSYDQSTRSYKNDSKGMLLRKEPNEIFLMTNEISMYTLPREFLALEFKDVTEGGIGNPMIQKNRSLENESYVVDIERFNDMQARFVTTTFRKK